MFLGRQGRILLDKLTAAADGDLQNEIIQAYLKGRLQAADSLLPVDHALNGLHEKGGNETVSRTAELSCLSLKQFERACQSRLGISPKCYGKLVRFTNLYRLKEQFSELPWGRLAAQCGYYDQMHMIRDFKQFTGMNSRIAAMNPAFRSFPFGRC